MRHPASRTARPARRVRALLGALALSVPSLASVACSGLVPSDLYAVNGTSAHDGGTSSGHSCSDLAACCITLSGSSQVNCDDLVGMGDESTCAAALQAEGSCGGSTVGTTGAATSRATDHATTTENTHVGTTGPTNSFTGFSSSIGGTSAFDAGVDSGPPIACGAESCSGGNTCCLNPSTNAVYCAASCATDDSLACMTPSDCGGSTPICCVNATGPECSVHEAWSQCTTVAGCLPTLASVCGDTGKLPLCETAAECATGNSCCALTVGGAPVRGCINSTVASGSGLTCY